MFKSHLQRFLLVTLMVSIFSPVTPARAMDGADLPETVQEGGSGWLGKTMVFGLVAGGLSWLWHKHYTQLHDIEVRFDKSSTTATAKEHNFLFATWRCNNDNAPDGTMWQTPRAVWLAHEGVAKTLYNDAQQVSDRVFVYDDFGVRIAHNNLTKMQIKQAIADELQWFRNQMNSVAAFTDMPQLIVDKYKDDEARVLSAHEIALTCADELKKLEEIDLDKLQEDLRQAADEAPKYKYAFHASGYLPTQWSVLPCYHKASRVYLKLFVSYARLCALDAVLNDTN